MMQAIVDDYVLSETVLKESRMHQELHFDAYLTADDVIAATRDTMEDTIAYIKDKYDDARGYMREVSIAQEWYLLHQYQERVALAWTLQLLEFT